MFVSCLSIRRPTGYLRVAAPQDQDIRLNLLHALRVRARRVKQGWVLRLRLQVVNPSAEDPDLELDYSAIIDRHQGHFPRATNRRLCRREGDVAVDELLKMGVRIHNPDSHRPSPLCVVLPG